ncbi:hypothetical protein HK096_002939 [Nowakowskiella sp. JEL0078]|nr:hypothetical protein HK096_002939 [Nowakowskiella sp. JEL0078]
MSDESIGINSPKLNVQTKNLSNPANVSLFSRVGVRVSYLNYFVSECGGRDILLNLTTGDICENYIQPRTSVSKLSLCEHLLKERSPHVAIAGSSSWFISHVWEYKFLEVVEAIQQHFQKAEFANSDPGLIGGKEHI